jgi:hypothetical protein
MSRVRSLSPFVAVAVGLALVASPCRSASLSPGELPDPVAKTFKETFPQGQIEKVDASEENGVMVYDIEFKDGKNEKETDIAADGTMLEFTLVIAARDIPATPMKAIRGASKGAKLGRLERIEITHETRDGQVIRLPDVVVHYAAEMARKGKQTEIIVGADGSVVEAPNWTGGK